MLAARSAWAILSGEHAELRRRLEALAGILESPAWRNPGASRAQLRDLLASLHDFDLASHRPKGVAMLEAMRGRSGDADRLLEQLRSERERDDDLLALGRLALDRGAADECAAALAQFHDGMLHQLDQEDSTLRLYAERVLTDEEWSTVVSSISSVLHPKGQAGESGGGGAAG